MSSRPNAARVSATTRCGLSGIEGEISQALAGLARVVAGPFEAGAATARIRELLAQELDRGARDDRYPRRPPLRVRRRIRWPRS
jgi:hypothetical protein